MPGLRALLLQPCTGKRITRVREGVVQALCSNMRWCTDGLEIHCWSGEIVRAAFVLDACDREVMAWAATTAGISGEIGRDLMLLSVEPRIGGYRAPHRIHWLSDNGSGYIAGDTIDFAVSLGNTATVLTKLDGGFEDYNSVHAIARRVCTSRCECVQHIYHSLPVRFNGRNSGGWMMCNSTPVFQLHVNNFPLVDFLPSIQVGSVRDQRLTFTARNAPSRHRSTVAISRQSSDKSRS